MRKKPLCLLMSFILLSIIFSSVIPAGDKQQPEIVDEMGDAFGYIDITSVWFYEKEEEPEYLYIDMEIDTPSESKFQQTFAAFWTFNQVTYFVSLHLGFDFFNWTKYRTGIHRTRVYRFPVEGIYDYDSGIITWKVPKDLIGNPQPGDVLTNTWSNAFRRLGFIGRIGFTRYCLDAIILRMFGNNMWDYAPERGEYGLDYEIQY
ncbi:MAG: hypothetical protein QCI00_06995 [Candidatus Thermoplasmatota archaeon]|nr:hypothetical protein [Candidatus Thermoplasmatota archaeon]